MIRLLLAISRRAIWAVVWMSIVCVAADAQPSRVITGRVISENGTSMPHVTVSISQVESGHSGADPGYQATAATDEEGNFRFSGLAPRVYRISVNRTREYVGSPALETEWARPSYYRLGDHAVITLIKGGVITGRITTPEGEPMVGVSVTATRVRDAEGHPLRQQLGLRTWLTDDRGIYRLYGLAPGKYLVSTKGSGVFSQMPYAGQLHIYHPYSTRDTAEEVTVMSGGEVTGIDILYRGDRRQVISGTVIGGPVSSSYDVWEAICLTNVVTGVTLDCDVNLTSNGRNRFAFYGVADGEYEIIARRIGEDAEESFASLPRRLIVKAADVTGVELKLAPMASLSGKIVLEPSRGLCQSKTRAIQTEIVLSTQRADQSSTLASPYSAPNDYGVDHDGKFTIPDLGPGNYHLEPLLPDETWYVKSIVVSPPTPVQRTTRASAARNKPASGITLKSGEKLTNIIINVTEGAASLQGKIIAKKENSPLPSRLRVHLVPSEVTAANDLRRYVETVVRDDLYFEFKNLAPGRYWLIARPGPDLELADRPALPSAWNDAERSKLRKEAEAGKIEVELKPCQRADGKILQF
jgi:Carboxypeptidase regulatory-like domain